MFCFKQQQEAEEPCSQLAKKFRIRQEKKIGRGGRKEKSSKTQVSKYVGKRGSVPHTPTYVHTHTHTLTLSLWHTLTHARSTARRPEGHGPALRLRLGTAARSGACLLVPRWQTAQDSWMNWLEQGRHGEPQEPRVACGTACTRLFLERQC